MNALCNVNISQRKGRWFLNGLEWDGSWVIVSPDGVWKPELQF